MTHREYLLRKAYLEEKKWGEPNKTEFYLMQIAQAVRQVLAKHPKRIKLSHFKMRFRGKEEKVTPQQKKAKLDASKSVWFGITGLGPDGKPRPVDEELQKRRERRRRGR